MKSPPLDNEDTRHRTQDTRHRTQTLMKWSPLDNEDAGIADLATSRLLELETLLTSILVLSAVREPRTKKRNMIMMMIMMMMMMVVMAMRLFANVEQEGT